MGAPVIVFLAYYYAAPPIFLTLGGHRTSRRFARSLNWIGVTNMTTELAASQMQRPPYAGRIAKLASAMSLGLALGLPAPASATLVITDVNHTVDCTPGPSFCQAQYNLNLDLAGGDDIQVDVYYSSSGTTG